MMTATEKQQMRLDTRESEARGIYRAALVEFYTALDTQSDTIAANNTDPYRNAADADRYQRATDNLEAARVNLVRAIQRAQPDRTRESIDASILLIVNGVIRRRYHQHGNPHPYKTVTTR